MNAAIQLNDITIHPVVEPQGNWFNVMEFFPTLTKEVLDENRSWLQPAFLDPTNNGLVLCIQGFVIKTPHHNILIDSCVGNHKPRPTRPFWNMLDSDRFTKSLGALALTVDDIDYVMCTHLHTDHVGWNTRLENGRWVPTFPKARYLFSKTELDFWLAEKDKGTAPPIADSVIPIVEAKRHQLVTSDYALNDLVSLIPTPGHTIDHYAVTLGKGGKDAIFTGDFIHSPLQAKWPDLAMRIDYDPLQSSATRWKLLEALCDTNTQCCFAHFPSPSRGYVKRWGDGFKCEYIL